MGRVANVYFNERLAGTLTEEANRYIFKYKDAYLAGGTPISFHLPLREEAYESEKLMPFFDNLAAEGWLRTLQSRLQKIDENDRFGLLLKNGADLAGAVTIKPAHTDN